jgi:hypothetical protein
MPRRLIFPPYHRNAGAPHPASRLRTQLHSNLSDHLVAIIEEKTDSFVMASIPSSSSRLARLFVILIPTILIASATALPVDSSNSAIAATRNIERRKTVFGGHGLVVGPGSASADFSGSGGIVVSPGKVTPGGFDITSQTLGLGGVPVEVSGGDLTLNGKPIVSAGGQLIDLTTSAQNGISGPSIDSTISDQNGMSMRASPIA